jgi:hypothetical protein
MQYKYPEFKDSINANPVGRKTRNNKVAIILSRKSQHLKAKEKVLGKSPSVESIKKNLKQNWVVQNDARP